MAVKKTIAIIGATGREGSEIALSLSSLPYRLLFVSEDQEKLSHLLESLTAKGHIAELDTINCVKDGCWEADIIFLTVPGCDEKQAARLMKEVATQKIVVALSDTNLGEILPYSKIVTLSDLGSGKATISANNPAALLEISALLQQAGYQLKTKN